MEGEKTRKFTFVDSYSEQFYNETIKINSLDVNMYEKIQKMIIDVLDRGEYVTVTGRDDNKTDMTVALNIPKKSETMANATFITLIAYLPITITS